MFFFSLFILIDFESFVPEFNFVYHYLLPCVLASFWMLDLYSDIFYVSIYSSVVFVGVPSLISFLDCFDDFGNFDLMSFL